MKLETLIEKWYAPKQLLGVSLTIQADSYAIEAVLLSLLKGSISIDERWDNLHSIEALREKLEKPLPIALSISGKSVLHQLMKNGANENEQQLLADILPGAKANDFYIQQEILKDKQAWISIARKEIVGKVLGEFKGTHLPVVALTLGPFNVTHLLPLLGEQAMEAKSLLTAHFSLAFQNDELSSFVKEETTSTFDYYMGDESISSLHTLPFANGMLSLANSNFRGKMALPQVIENYTEWLHQGLFGHLLKGSLALIFVLLLGNYLVFDWQYRKYQALEEKMVTSKGQFTLLDQLKKQYTQSEQFLASQGWMEAPRASYYADRVAITIPQEMQLTGMELYPPQPVINKEDKDKLRFDAEVIEVSGIVKQSTIINEWIAVLKELDWVNKVQVVNYEQEKPNSQGSFDLKIFIR